VATFGALGSTVFSVSANTVRTFSNMSWNTSTNYAVHDRHLTGALLEYVGESPDTMSFDMVFSVYLGIDPVSEINKLYASQSAGRVMMLIIGSYRYGRRWVITDLKMTLQQHDNRGNLLIAKVKVGLKSYS